MFNLLSLEYKKFRKNSVVSLLSLFYVLFLPAVMILIKDFKPESLGPGSMFIPGPETYYTFPGVWEYVGYAGNWMVFFFLGVVVIYLITAEVNFKTQRQTLINGMPRKTYFTSKFLAVVAISFLATIYYAIVSAGIGMYFTDDWDFAFMFENEYAIPRYFLMSIAYLSFAALLAILLKKSGLAIFIYMSYVMIIEPLLKVGLKFKDWAIKDYANYLPLNAVEDLMPNPFFLIDVPIADKMDIVLSYSQSAIASIIFIAIFVAWSYFVFMKRDL